MLYRLVLLEPATVPDCRHPDFLPHFNGCFVSAESFRAVFCKQLIKVVLVQKCLGETAL